MTPFDGTCRGNGAGKIWEWVSDNGPRTIGFLSDELGLSIRYIRSLVQGCDVLEFTSLGRLVRHYAVAAIKENR